jgi:branched-chain amino acid transport system permease protein
VNVFLTAIVGGLAIGSLYTLVALGYSFVFQTTGTFNFAQGQLVTFGSLFTYTLYVSLGIPAGVAVFLVMLLVGALAGLTERVAIWPLARRGDESLKWLMSTFGVAILLTGGAQRIWGPNPRGVPNYFSKSIINLGDRVSVSSAYAFAFVIAIFLTLAIEAFQRFSASGRIMRAVGDNRTAVELAGVNVLRLGCVAFAVSGAMAGLAGFVIVPVTYADPSGGFNFLLLSFAALAIGGFTSHWGALVGGWLVGLAASLSETYLGLQYGDIAVFVLMLSVLLVRPQGLANRLVIRDV